VLTCYSNNISDLIAVVFVNDISHFCSIVSVVARLRAGRPGFDSWQGQGFFSLPHHVKTGSGAHPVSCQLVPGAPSSGIKRPERET